MKFCIMHFIILPSVNLAIREGKYRWILRLWMRVHTFSNYQTPLPGKYQLHLKCIRFVRLYVFASKLCTDNSLLLTEQNIIRDWVGFMIKNRNILKANYITVDWVKGQVFPCLGMNGCNVRIHAAQHRRGRVRGRSTNILRRSVYTEA